MSDLRQMGRRLVDWGPALLLAAYGELDVSLQPSLGSVFPGPALAHRLFVLAATLPTAFRRRYPLGVQIVTTVVTGVWVAVLYPPAVQPPLEAFLVILLVTYSAAVHAEGRRVWVAAAVAATWMPGTIITAVRAGQAPGGALASWVLVAAVFGFGLIIRRQRSLTRRLADYARELEHEREERSALAAALERSRIARELHDVIAHSLSMMVVQAAAERRVLKDPGSPTAEVLRTIEESGRQAMAEMRRLLGVLRRTDEPAQQVPQPRLKDLDLLVEQVRTSGLAVALRVDGEPHELPPGVELSAYRIVQESLSNTLKHAGRAHAEVHVGFGPQVVEIEVTDDGRGGSSDSAGGHGLLGMRERVSLYGGSLEAGPRPEGGYRVRAVLPTAGVAR
jgi:signal transduction histidine kinase